MLKVDSTHTRAPQKNEKVIIMLSASAASAYYRRHFRIPGRTPKIEGNDTEKALKNNTRKSRLTEG